MPEGELGPAEARRDGAGVEDHLEELRPRPRPCHALVPYRVSGAGADQTQARQHTWPPVHTRGQKPETDRAQETRLFQVGAHAIRLAQQPAQSGARRGPRPAPPTSGEADLSGVGLVVWESSFVLAHYLMERGRFRGCWGDVRALDLGCGTGLVGVALALAGAHAVLADLAHVTPLAEWNVAANCRRPPHRAEVVEYAWGDPVEPLGAPFDLVAGADVVYQEEHFPALLATLDALCQPHTMCYLAFRLRGRGEEEFEGRLRGRGFAVERVRPELLHEEYRTGTYVILQACKL